MWYSNMPPHARALWGHLRGHSKYNVHQSSIHKCCNDRENIVLLTPPLDNDSVHHSDIPTLFFKLF